MTSAEQAAALWQKLVRSCLGMASATGSTTTFALYRRQTVGAADDLGIPNDPWAIVVGAEALPGTFVGIKTTNVGGVEVPVPGRTRYEEYEAVVAYLGVRSGDNVVVALDGRAYEVMRAEQQGAVMYLSLRHGTEQVQP